MQKIALIGVLLVSLSAAQAQDDQGRYRDQEQERQQEQYRQQQDQRQPATMDNGTLIVPSGSGYTNTRNGDYYPETSPGWVINPRTGEPIYTR